MLPRGEAADWAGERGMEELLEIAQRYWSVFEKAAVGISIIDLNGNFVETNPALQEMLGYAAEELRQIHFSQITNSGDLEDSWHHFEELIEGKGDRYQLEELCIRKDGRPIWVRQTASLARGRNGEPLYVIGVIEDIEQRRRVEEDLAHQLRIQQALEQQKEEFVTAAAHDLKTPLTVAKGTTQMLHRAAKRGTLDEERLVAGLEQINSTIGAMSDLIQELLEASRAEYTGEIEQAPVDLSEMARAVVERQRQATRGHQLGLEIDAEPIIVGDAARLGRVLGNLINNAIKYSPEGGGVTVRVGQTGDMAEVVVEDQGIGIPTNDLPHIFDRCYRGANVSARGTGIGLHVAKQTVEQHGGAIEVESQEGKGSTFTIRLPLFKPLFDP